MSTISETNEGAKEQRRKKRRRKKNKPPKPEATTAGPALCKFRSSAERLMKARRFLTLTQTGARTAKRKNEQAKVDGTRFDKAIGEMRAKDAETDIFKEKVQRKVGSTRARQSEIRRNMPKIENAELVLQERAPFGRGGIQKILLLVAIVALAIELQPCGATTSHCLAGYYGDATTSTSSTMFGRGGIRKIIL